MSSLPTARGSLPSPGRSTLVGEGTVVGEGRERRSDGRPEQARPRDRTGRPLPYGTTGVLTTDDVAPASIAQAIALGCRRWEERRYFEAHELLELAWKDAVASQDRDFWQGVIQVAVAGVHLQRGNAVGAKALLERAARRIVDAPGDWQGLDIDALRRRAAHLLTELAAGRMPEPDLGVLTS